MELKDINIYRMTHIDNISHILENGITHKTSTNSNSSYVSIGDVSLINNRSSKTVSILDSSKSIVLGNFIPFYFGVKMPMLYVIQNGGNFVNKPTPSEQIIYMAYDIKKVISLKIEYYFSDGHATDNFTTFYDKNSIEKLPNLINWKAVKEKYWGGNENLNLKRKKQAEFLVGKDLPMNGIIGFACFNEVAKKELVRMGVSEEMIKVFPQAYF